MTDDEIRDLFAELDRVGVDPGRPPGLAIGTGFPPGELVAWLRTLPDDARHDAFVAALDDEIKLAAFVERFGPSDA